MLRKHTSQHQPMQIAIVNSLPDINIAPLLNDAKTAAESTDTIIQQYEPVSVLTSLAGKLIQNGPNASIESIQIAHSTVTSISKKLGIDSTIRLPAMECFENKHESRIAHNVATESIIDMIVSVWRAIKNALIRMWEAIKSFFRNLFDVSKQLERQIESLKKDIEELGNCNSQPTFTDDDIVKAFTINNRFVNSNVTSILDNHCEVTSDLNRLSGKLKEITSGSFDAMKAITDRLKTYIEPTPPEPDANPSSPYTPDVDMQSITEKNPADTSMFINDNVKAMMGELRNGLVTLLNLRVTSNTNEGVIGVSKKAYLYGKRLELSAVSQDDAVELLIEVITPDNSIKHTIAVLTINEMRSILVGCSKLLKMDSIVANTVTNIDKATNYLIKIIEQIEDTLSTINKDIQLKENLVKASDSLKGFKLYTNSILGVINTVYTQIPIMNVKAIKLSLKLVEISAGKYSRK